MADIRIYDMHGIFGVYQKLDLWQSYLLSFFVYIVIINAVNLIDGLDGLAAGIGFLASVAFGFIFYYSGNVPLSLLAFVLSGSLLGFLIFNFSRRSTSMSLGHGIPVVGDRFYLDSQPGLIPRDPTHSLRLC